MSIFQAHGAELVFWVGGAVVLIGVSVTGVIGAVKLTWWLRDGVGNIIGHLQGLDAKVDAVNVRLDTLNVQVAKNTQFREENHTRLIEATEASSKATRAAMERLEEMQREREAERRRA